MATCGLCHKVMSECEKNIFCARTIINKKKHITFNNEWGEDIEYFSFSECINAMKEYAEQVLHKENIGTREILIEKIEQ